MQNQVCIQTYKVYLHFSRICLFPHTLDKFLLVYQCQPNFLSHTYVPDNSGNHSQSSHSATTILIDLIALQEVEEVVHFYFSFFEFVWVWVWVWVFLLSFYPPFLSHSLSLYSHPLPLFMLFIYFCLFSVSFFSI